MRVRFSLLFSASVVICAALTGAPRARGQAAGEGPMYPVIANLSTPLALPASGDGSTAEVPPSHQLLDLDKDGHLDAISLYRGCSTWRGLGDGTFEPPIEWPSGEHMRLGELADMNGDDVLDAVLPDFGSFFGQPPGAIVVLLGAPDGSFGSPVVTPLAADPVALTAADFDGDGHADVATFVYGVPGSPRLWMLPGAGTGELAPTVSDVHTMNFPETIYHADLNGDRVLDVVITHHDDGCCFCGGSFHGDVITRWRGLGDGSFEQMIPYLCTVDYLRRLEVADVNDDGRPDFLVQAAEATSWIPNLGGAFGIEVPIAASGFHSLLFESSGELFDFNGGVSAFEGDGHADLLTSDNTSHRLLPGLGGGAFANAVASNESGFAPLGLGDVDQDGRLDAVGAVGGTNVVLRGLGDGSFEGPRLLLPDLNVTIDEVNWDVVEADFDADGVSDFAAKNTSKVVVILSNGPAAYDPPVSYAVASSGIRTAAGDFDGDGLLDLLTQVSGDPAILPGTGNGSFGAPIIIPADWSWIVTVGDFDGDGLSDIVTLSGGHTVALLAQGGFTFSPLLPVALGVTASSGVARDFDGDEVDDLMLSSSSGMLSVLSTGDGGFGALQHVPCESSLDGLAAGDVDGDGALDVVVTLNDGFSDGRLVVVRNLGAGSFGPYAELRTLGHVTDVEVADVDRDGQGDIVAGTRLQISSPTSSALLVYRNEGLGAFADSLGFGPGETPVAITVRDANSDGWPDLCLLGGDQLTLLQHQWGPWENRGHALVGVAGRPRLDGYGPLLPRSEIAFELTSASPSSACALVLGLTEVLAPFKGGVLVPDVDVLVPGLATDAQGRLMLQAMWPADVPSQASLVAQFWISDTAGPAGLSASNGVRMTVP